MSRKITSRFLDRASDALAGGDPAQRRRRLALQFLRLQLDSSRPGRPAADDAATDDTAVPRAGDDEDRADSEDRTDTARDR